MDNGQFIIDDGKFKMDKEQNPVNPIILKIRIQTIFAHLQKMGFVWS